MADFVNRPFFVCFMRYRHLGSQVQSLGTNDRYSAIILIQYKLDQPLTMRLKYIYGRHFDLSYVRTVLNVCLVIMTSYAQTIWPTNVFKKCVHFVILTPLGDMRILQCQ